MPIDIICLGKTKQDFIIDGINDFQAGSELIDVQSHSLFITWDVNNLYIGFYDMDLNIDGDLFVNIDTDQTIGSGATSGSWGRVDFMNPYLPEYQIAIEGGGGPLPGGSMQVNNWTGTVWNYPGNGAIGNSYEGWMDNGLTEMAIPWIDLGSPVGFAISVHISGEDTQNVPEIFPELNTTGDHPTIEYFYAFYEPYVNGPMPLSGIEPNSVVAVPNTSPEITAYNPSVLNQTILVETTVNFDITAFDLENDDIVYSWALDGTTVSLINNFSYTPASADVGIHTLLSTATDNIPGNIADSVTWTIEVIESVLTFDLRVFLEGPFQGTEMQTNLNNYNVIPLAQPYYTPPWNYPGSEEVLAIPGLDIVDWIFVEIRDAVDYFLVHNRRIVNRVDDSVVRFVDGKRAVIRRSRGFVPLPAGKTSKYNGLAMGAELMNSFAIVKNGTIYPSQYIGNTAKIEVMDFFQDALRSFRSLLGMENIDLVVIDSHPFYNTSKFGKEFDSEILKVQHHFAHIASIMAEKGVEEIIGIAIDAVGYGLDGKTWGGEIIEISNSGIKRLEHIEYYPLPGGDLAAYYPIRSLIGVLSKIYERDEIESILRERCPDAIKALKYGARELHLILSQMEKNVNIAYASSTGRFLDAIAVFLNVAYQRTYEGEPAMKLESAALNGNDLGFEIEWGDGIKVHQLVERMVDSRARRRDLAYTTHISLAKAFARAAIYHAHEKGIKRIGVSGGVAYNQLIMSEIKKLVEREGFEFLSTEDVPRGDNGISVGQTYIGGLYMDGKVRKNEVG